MVRTVFVPERNQVTFPIPDNYVGMKLEMLLFPVGEAMTSQDLTATPQKREAGSLKGQIIMSDDFDDPVPVKTKTFSAMKIKTQGFKFNRDEANE